MWMPYHLETANRIERHKEDRMKATVCFAALLSVALLAACSTLRVQSDWDHSADFSAYHTYAWYDGESLPGDALAKNPLLRKRVQEAVDEVLLARGGKLVPKEQADIFVVVHAGTTERMQVTDWGRYGWYDPWWGPYGGSVDVSYYEEGTLVIDFVDSKKKELVWRGLGTKVIQQYSDPDERMEAIRHVVEKILAQYPPSGTSE
jgi:hypothetical protein